MRKFFLVAVCSMLLVTGCQKSSAPSDENFAEETGLAPTQRKCAAQEVLEEQMKADPGLRQRMNEIETFIQRVNANPGNLRLVNGVIQIPVVVNVLYKTNAQNISNDQIQSQIDILNQDFSATNSDYDDTPEIFQSARSGNIGIEFVLDRVIRLRTKTQSWPINDAMKKASKGGINPTDPTTKLNFWVCNLTSGYLGYAQFPGGNAVTDGVVIDDNAFGNIGNLYPDYNLGRTATHEVGHWMYLRHIWGDTNCGNDLVGDTPQHNAANFSCPGEGHLSTCTGTPQEMWMNYMDYTDDRCMFMFTLGQKARMLAIFDVGGSRNSFAQP